MIDRKKKSIIVLIFDADFLPTCKVDSRDWSFAIWLTLNLTRQKNSPRYVGRLGVPCCLQKTSDVWLQYRWLMISQKREREIDIDDALVFYPMTLWQYPSLCLRLCDNFDKLFFLFSRRRSSSSLRFLVFQSINEFRRLSRSFLDGKWLESINMTIRHWPSDGTRNFLMYVLVCLPWRCSVWLLSPSSEIQLWSMHFELIDIYER